MATTHTVVKGDTLWDIAQKYLGSGLKYKQLAAINNISNPNLIYVGQVIKLTSDGGSDTGSSSGSTTTSTNKPTINQFGVSSVDDTLLFATWDWSKSNTENYKVLWTYDTGDGIWYVGNNSTISVDEDSPEISRQSTYTIPTRALSVRFKVKPISKTYTKNDVETRYWEASWSNEKTYINGTPLETPSAPSVEIDKYTLTATLENIEIDATEIEFEIIKDNSPNIYKIGKSSIITNHASFSCSIDAGGEYKARCRAKKGSYLSDWSLYSSNVSTIPGTPTLIRTMRASSKTSVYLEWVKSSTAETYDIEYTTKLEYFDSSDQTTIISGIEFTNYDVSGLETGSKYFFRVRAVNSNGHSGWSAYSLIVLGNPPDAPTTWSSTTTAITGEPLTLYWIHNSEDGSSQVYAELELYINGVKESHTIKNTDDEEEKDKTSSYSIDTSIYVEGTKIEWRVRTSGITNEYGDWSIQRTIDIYAPPTLEMSILNEEGNVIDNITSFPFYVSALAGPSTQLPIGYQLMVISNDTYETIDNMGKNITINSGDELYSKYFDISNNLMVEFSANNITLDNNINYTIKCTVSMNSGLTAVSSLDFNVTWDDILYEPNAEISIDEKSLIAYVRPYCDKIKTVAKKVEYSNNIYSITDEKIYEVWGEIVSGAKTTTGEQVYSGMDYKGDELYFCRVKEITPVTDVLLSVYRREFNGSFVELAYNLDGEKNITITDPHPALDYARYRIVAKTKKTGDISYYDPPGIPIGGKSVVIQWDEEWTNFETKEDDVPQQPPWSGSLLKIMYNIDISDSNAPDVTLVEYIGRENPIGYYGTQRGHMSTWSMVIEKKDKETLYALRRLQNWMGDVYVREPSGSGYWANISVSFSQKHKDLTIPVTLSIKRVEGGT